MQDEIGKEDFIFENTGSIYDEYEFEEGKLGEGK